MFGHKSCPFPLTVASWNAVHEPLETLNKFAETINNMVTFSLFILGVAVIHKPFVTPTPTARRWRKGGVLPVTQHSRTTLVGYSVARARCRAGTALLQLGSIVWVGRQWLTLAPMRCLSPALSSGFLIVLAAPLSIVCVCVCFYRGIREAGTCVCVCVCRGVCVRARAECFASLSWGMMTVYPFLYY